MSVVIMASLTIMIINSKMIRRDELESAVALSCRNTLSKMVEETDSLREEEQAKDVFFQELFLNMRSESDDICVSFYDIDCDNGLLSVGVKESYKNLLGITTTLHVKRTVILQ
ncbi:MAG: hypothetical protein K6G88_07790 [Lachnospiraceae bacterium]|nr:hypothetical protein [Lachnospiraceae bacterium]